MKDIAGHWAEKEIRDATRLGLMAAEEDGGDGKFYPDAPVTRAEMAAVLMRLYNLIYKNY